MALPGDGGGRPGGGERESAAVWRPHRRPPARTCGRKVLGALRLGRDRYPHSPWTLPVSSGLRSGRLGAQSQHRARQSAARGRRGVAWRGASAQPTAGPGNPAPGLSPSRPAAEGWPRNFGGVKKSWVIRCTREPQRGRGPSVFLWDLRVAQAALVGSARLVDSSGGDGVAAVFGSLKHLSLDSLVESELPPNLQPYLAGCARLLSRGCTGPGVGGAWFLCFPAGVVTLSP